MASAVDLTGFAMDCTNTIDCVIGEPYIQFPTLFQAIITHYPTQ